MATKFFNRNDPETIQSALTDTLVQFLEKHAKSTSEEILKKAHAEIRGKHQKKTVNQQIVDRLSDEGDDEVLSPQEDLLLPIQALEQEEIDEMLQKEHENPGVISPEEDLELRENFPANVEGSEELNLANHLTESEKEVIRETDISHITDDSALEGPINGNSTDEANFQKVLFKSLPLEEKISIVRSYKEKLGDVKTGPIKKAIEKDGVYEITHYDDVYNVFIKL